jgi:DNA-binding beta-propeller fold protein YncE
VRLYILSLLTLGCGDLSTGGKVPSLFDSGVGALGYESHSMSGVNVTIIGTASDGLNVPRDLAMNPDVHGELFVVNRADDSATIFSAVGTEDQTSRHVIDPFAQHFMEEVSSIAFGAHLHGDGEYPNFSTCHESRNTYNGTYVGDDFMGPTLWTSDPDIFGFSNPEAIEYLSSLPGVPNGTVMDLGSHIDMLHESPLCMGVAWEEENIYWVFDGLNGSIDRVDFAADHGVGYDDHSDGIITQYIKGEVERLPDVPSHLEYEPTTGLLYIADTGNNAIKVLDTTSGNLGSALPVMEEGTTHHNQDDVTFWTLIEGSDHGMVSPSGLAIVQGHLIITDHGTGIIHAFDMDGQPVDWLDTELGEGALMGIWGERLSELWFVNARDNRVVRLRALDATDDSTEAYEDV